MTVKVKRKIEVGNEKKEITRYLPENALLTKGRMEKADRLDDEIKNFINGVNSEYENLKNNFKGDDFKKWKWLGSKINEFFKKSAYVEQTDIDNNHIWPAISQYLIEDLSRGVGTKRSGTPKDHYRKCYLLAILPNLDWVNNWSSWDAFIDRGEQLVLSKKVMSSLERKISNKNLSVRQYQVIAKKITEKLPSRTSIPVSIDSMKDEEVENIINKVIEEIIH